MVWAHTFLDTTQSLSVIYAVKSNKRKTMTFYCQNHSVDISSSVLGIVHLQAYPPDDTMGAGRDTATHIAPACYSMQHL